MANDCCAKAASGRLTTLAVLTLFCSCFLPAVVAGQSDSQASSTATKKSGTHTVKHAAASTSKTAKSSTATAKSHSSTSAKNRSASHSATTEHGKASTVAATRRGKKGRAVSKKTTARGQQKIDPERAEQIQEALIREHYLTGEPAGTWNQTSEDALRRYQADHGWQSKTVPDSRALISLGLGPSHDHLLNPESAMTTGPEIPHPAATVSSTSTPVSHSPEPASASAANSGATTDPAPSAVPKQDTSSPQK